MDIISRRNQIIAMLYQNMDKAEADETLSLIDKYVTEYSKMRNKK